MIEEVCPSCGQEMNGYECQSCGFGDMSDESRQQYETPQGNIIWCTEEEAFDNGYIYICPVDCYNTITWWEMEDHGCCIECWHKRHKRSLTIKEKSDIIKHD